MKKMRIAISLFGVLLLSACGASSNTFPVAANHHNLSGIWATWNDDGNFEFFDFIAGQFLQGYVKPEAGVVSFIRIGGYHFHGDSGGHAFFNWAVYEDGEQTAIEEHFLFTAGLSRDGNRLQIIDRESDQTWQLYYLGEDLHNLTHEVGTESTFFEGYELAWVVDAVWGMATLHEMPAHGH